MVALPQPGNAFTRRLLNDDHTLIESRCKQCGACIVGSVMNGLKEQELDHFEHCPRSLKTQKRPPHHA